jgi:hypothetical protein
LTADLLAKRPHSSDSAKTSKILEINLTISDVSQTWGHQLNAQPSTALGDFASALDANAVADITSLLSGDLAPNASGWVVDLFSLF